MDNKDLILKVPDFVDKNDNYYIFKGLSLNLSAKEVCDIFDFKFKFGKLKEELILNKILLDLNIYINASNRINGPILRSVNLKNQKIYISLFKKLLKKIQKTTDYRKNQKIAKFLYRICPAMPNLWQKKLIEYFLSSGFRGNQNRALEFLGLNWDDDFSKKVIDAWDNGGYFSALRLIIKKIDKEYFNEDLFKSIECYFEEVGASEDDLFENSYEDRNLRNKFYSRFTDRYSEVISDLKTKDPISYIFVQKDARRSIDSDFAIKVYNENKRARMYLPRVYAEMGLSDVINDLIK